jgi:hypothetical protein
MNKISLSAEDKERILANVKKAYEQTAESGTAEQVTPLRHRPRFSTRRIGTVAAACLVVIASALLIRNQFKQGEMGHDSDLPVSPSAVSASGIEVWEEYDSVEEISEKTDCKTYTLSNLSKSYKVKKVEVANEQRHVRITYKSDKHNDKILFEYKEEENSPAITEQFSDENEMKKENVDGSTVTMYGESKCDGMTWEKESCTFSVRMSKGRSTVSAKKLIKGTKKESEKKISSALNDKKEETSQKINSNAIGWDEDDFNSDDSNASILDDIYQSQGFRVTVKEPAERIVYKEIDDYESFTFLYGAVGVLEGKRIIGYAGWNGCPDGVLDGYEETDSYFADGTDITMYQKGKYDRLFIFTLEDVEITLLLDNFKGDEMEDMLEMLLDVFHVSKEDEKDSEPKTTEKPKATENPKETPSSVSKAGVSGEPEESAEKEEKEGESHLNSTTVTP